MIGLAAKGKNFIEDLLQYWFALEMALREGGEQRYQH
jgi:hypothetical protein